MNLNLKLLSEKDNNNDKYFEFLQKFPDSERFPNPALGIKREKYKQWLILKEEQSRGINLEKGEIQQYLYWIMLDEKIIGIGLIRPKLNETYLKRGGHIGIGFLEECRGKGYGSIAMKLLIKQAKEIHNIKECLITIIDFNIASRKVAEKNGAKLKNIDNRICYYWC